MFNYFPTNLWLLVHLIHIVNASNPVYPKCDCKIINNIKHIWEIIGTPQNLTQLHDYTFVSTSFKFPGDPKCVLVTSEPHCNSTATVVVTYIPKDRRHKVTTSTYNVTESNGVVTGTDGYTGYNIFAGNGIIINYVCDKNGVKEGPPVVNILMANDSWNRYCTQNTVRSGKALLSLLGFELPYAFRAECFNSC